MQHGTSLDRIRQWREQYRTNLDPSPLEDINQLAAQLDLTHAHPSGIAQLFAGGHATLESLFRDAGMLRAAGRRLERVLDDQAGKQHAGGVAGLSLVVGVATWKGYSLPVLLYPVEVERRRGGPETEATIRFSGQVSLNPSFVAALREQHIELNEDELFDGSNYESGTPETSALFEAITKQANQAFADFAIERRLVLGCFLDTASQILRETQHIIDSLYSGSNRNMLLAAIAADPSAIEFLQQPAVPEYSAFDGDPHMEYEVGDVDNEVRYAASVAASGRSLFIDAAPGDDTAQQAAAVASRCVMSNRSVLYVPCVADQKRRFVQAMHMHELGGQVLDLSTDDMNGSIDRQLIAAVSFQPGVATSRFEQVSDELVGIRSRLSRYLGDLHGVSGQWGVSAYQTIQNLANIAAWPSHPATRVRLGRQAAMSLNGHIEEWGGKLREAGDLGEYTIGPEDTAWYKASVFSQEEAVDVYQRVVDLLRKLLPATREQVANTVETCGFPIPSTAQEWACQVTVLKNLRRVLDVFQPEIFERDLTSMIEASKPKAKRKLEGSTMGFWERRRHIKEAKGLLRVGTQIGDLHEALNVVARQAEEWRTFVPHGGWPVLPSKLDSIIETQESLMSDFTALDTVLASTPQGGSLETLDFNAVEERLKALYDDRRSLDTLPGRSRLEREFQNTGLAELVDDLHIRHVPVDGVEAELQLAWWTTIFEDIVRSSPIISNQDGSALQTASDRFVQVDEEHVRSVGVMVQQESMRHLCDLLFARTQEANQMHTVLAGPSRLPLEELMRDHPQMLAAAKPVMVATPDTLVALSVPSPLADVVIIDAAAHLEPIELLPILARSRQVVVLAHRGTVTSPSVATLVDMLARVTLRPRPIRSNPQLFGFLESHGYGDIQHETAVERVQGEVRFHGIEATGVPVMASGLVESSQQEIDQVVDMITTRASQFTIVPSGYVLAVVTLTSVFRRRLGVELKSLAAKNPSMARFLRHVRLLGVNETGGAPATDVILSMCYAKTAHGRLLQQFGMLEGEGGQGMLLDALAMPDRDLDIVAAFGSKDLDDERLHQPGPKLLKSLLQWAETIDDRQVRPVAGQSSNNVLFNDLAERIRARGLNAALDYGFSNGTHIPLVVGLNNKPFALAVLTDDADFMGIQSTRARHRVTPKDFESLGWSVITVWSVGAFVNPEHEVDRIVDSLGELYKDVR